MQQFDELCRVLKPPRQTKTHRSRLYHLRRLVMQEISRIETKFGRAEKSTNRVLIVESKHRR